jgi:hypothetical protein
VVDVFVAGCAFARRWVCILGEEFDVWVSVLRRSWRRKYLGRMLDAGCWMLNAGRLMLDVRWWIGFRRRWKDFGCGGRLVRRWRLE